MARRPSIRERMRHAFAVDPPGPAEPADDEERRAVERIVHEIARRHLVTPALMSLEIVRPMNWIGAQALHLFTPFIAVFTETGEYRAFTRFLERRGSIDYICGRLESIEADREAARRGGPADDPTKEDPCPDDDSASKADD